MIKIGAVELSLALLEMENSGSQAAPGREINTIARKLGIDPDALLSEARLYGSMVATMVGISSKDPDYENKAFDISILYATGVLIGMTAERTRAGLDKSPPGVAT
jgi:hypothetical protein